MVGRMQMLMVRQPARMEVPSRSMTQKKVKPNRPKMMEGTPESTSVVNRMERTSRPCRAYWVR